MSDVYFIKPVGMTGPIKIGASKCVEARLIELQAGSPIKLELLAQTENVGRLEYRLHSHFHSLRSHNEWFHPAPVLLALIATICDGAFDPATLPKGFIADCDRRPSRIGTQSMRAAKNAAVLAALA